MQCAWLGWGDPLPPCNRQADPSAVDSSHLPPTPSALDSSSFPLPIKLNSRLGPRGVASDESSLELMMYSAHLSLQPVRLPAVTDNSMNKPNHPEKGPAIPRKEYP